MGDGEGGMGDGGSGDTIQIVRNRRGVVLQIPGRQQKNRKHQLIPTTPAFVELLNEHPRQTSYVFDLPKLNGQPGRPTVNQVGRIVSDIGERVGVIVNDANKFPSSHDLRHSFGWRMRGSHLVICRRSYVTRRSPQWSSTTCETRRSRLDNGSRRS